MSYTFKLKDSVTLPVTQELIDEFANMVGSITERPKDENRAAFIRGRITAGLAVAFNWSKAQIEGEKDWYRVNGQHSSLELQDLQGLNMLPEGLIAHVDSYVVPDKAGLVALFRQFDTRQSSRTPLEVTNAYASVEDDLVGVSRKIVKLAAEGIWWYRKNVLGEQDAAKNDDRYAIVMEQQYHPFIMWLAKVHNMKTRELAKPHVAAAMWSTFQVGPLNTAEFWGDVAGNMPSGTVDGTVSTNGPDSTEPAVVLDNYLVRAHQKIIDVQARDIYQGSMYAWNAYVDDKEITKIAAPSWRTKGFIQPKIPDDSPKQIAAE